MTVDNISYGQWTSMSATGLQLLAIDTTDPYVGWQSARVDNQTTTKAIDFEVQFNLPTTGTAPANDKAVYAYLVPWMYDGASWTPAANFGTTVRPTGIDTAASITDPNSMKGPYAMPYQITSQPIDGYMTVGQMCGGIVPDGWSLAIRNNCGAALSSGCSINYRPITFTNV